MKSIKIKSIVLYASLVVAIIGVIQPIKFEASNGLPSATNVVYAAEQPSDSIPFCKDERLPIHALCHNMDSQAGPRMDQLTDLSIEIVNGIIERLDSR